MKYYRLLDDLEYMGRWYLDEIDFPEDINFWDYITVGKPLPDISNLEMNVLKKGTPLDLTMGAFEFLIANEFVANIFSDEDVFKVPVKIVGREHINHFILVIKKEYDCVDRGKSVYEIWEVDNDIRPDLAGEYKVISNLVVDESLTEKSDVFRIKGYSVAIIASEKIKSVFEKCGITGVKFKEV